MKIIKPSFEILSFPENIELLETAGRTCYQSEPNGNPETFVKNIVDSGHESVIEHLSATVRIVCDRGVMAELTRHRIGVAFSIESTRYCNYAKQDDIEFIEPCFWTGYDERLKLKIDEQLKLNYESWVDAMTFAEIFYKKLMHNGATPQQARSVLPNSLKTEIIMTANFRAWRHIFKLRCSGRAHPQIIEIMIPLREEFQRRCGAVFM